MPDASIAQALVLAQTLPEDVEAGETGPVDFYTIGEALDHIGELQPVLHPAAVLCCVRHELCSALLGAHTSCT